MGRERTVADTDRQRVVQAFQRVLGRDAGATFRELLPRRRWREVLSSEAVARVRAGRSRADEDRVARLHDGLVDMFGHELADLTMEYLLPAPWRVLREQGLDRHPW